MCLSGHEYKFKNHGPYCYRINGQVYHVISQMQPEEGKPPGFFYIYILYDQHNELENQKKSFSNLDHNLLQQLQDEL